MVATTTAKTKVDEWVFSLRLPPSIIEGGSDKDKRRLVQLRQEQPSVNHNNNNSNSKSTDTHDSSSIENGNNGGGGGLAHGSGNDHTEQERLLLLQEKEFESNGNGDGGSGGVGATGWTLTSPFWSFGSQSLLKVTYCPAWQNIPEYTTCPTCASSSSLRKGGGNCCGCNCACVDRVDWYADTFYVKDIVRVQHVPDFKINGVGDCQAVKIYLRPLHLADDLPAMPDYLASAWETHVQHMASQQSNSNSSSEASSSHGGAGGGGSSPRSSTLPIMGPIVTFCLSANTGAPLLWKVSFPAVEGVAISVDSLTVADGKLSTGNNNNNNNNTVPLPTHIYINGYQSWSFAGSVAKGCDQPQSALPNVFSGAFLEGGTPPPAATAARMNDSGGDDDELRLTDDNDDDQVQQRQVLLLLPPFKLKYQSDFFTCLTADTTAPTWRTPRVERVFPYQQLDERGGPALILGWLSQRQQFGVICSDKELARYQMHASCHGQIIMGGGGTTGTAGTAGGLTTTGGTGTGGLTTDWAYCQLLSPHSYDEEPLVHYLHAAAAHNHARPLQNGNLLTGWCSWYHYYENISEKVLRENFIKLAAMRTKLPTNVAVVDDGYMTAWGDWSAVKPKKFSSMANVSRDIVRNEMRPGIWLAPYGADKHSKVAEEHPDWILRNDQGLAANSSYCGKFFYGLDATNPKVRQHAFDAIHRAVSDWNFNVLKLDFLYAACLRGNGRYDLSLSRAQAMDLAVKTLRDAAGPDTFIIGCGCPIGTAIGYVDGMRVSADTGPTWYPPLPMPYWDQGTLPCLRSMIRNSLSRAPMGHRWWHNDPDCLLLGESTRLTEVEVASAASIVAMTCGMMLLSDDLTKVTLSRMRILTKVFPMTGVSGVVLDLHNTNDGLPSLLRLWCTDKDGVLDNFRDTILGEVIDRDFNAEATYFARKASFSPDEIAANINERRRSCIHVTRGLGTWTFVSISNWSNKPAVVHVPPMALLPPPPAGGNNEADDAFLGASDESVMDPGVYGSHVFAFWSSKYSWLPPPQALDDDTQGPEQTVSKKLAAHETEIYHVKPVTPDAPQYIGSDLHFSCGHEVRLFRAAKNSVEIALKTDYNRVGHIFVFVPRISTDNVKVMVNGEPGRWVAVGNTPNMNENGSPRLAGRIIRIMLVVHANGSEMDGQVRVEY